MEIIREELAHRGVKLPAAEAPVIERCIHTSADFDYYENLVFSSGAVERMRAALSAGAMVVTDTEMAKSGISKVALSKYDGKIRCFMSDPEVSEEAKKRGITRATVSMEHAARLAKHLPKIKFDSISEASKYENGAAKELHAYHNHYIESEPVEVLKNCSFENRKGELHEKNEEGVARRKVSPASSNIIFAIGNAPTALIELERLIREENLRPAGIIAVPVGFVNVVEAKELIWELRNEPEYGDIPLIVARGRKGGSNIAAAIVNALLYGIKN
ncbi:Precorrin-8X methylmutase [Oribacterium sp. WCC10]|nr:Precorrin-8X methylmutase [Oribacterium sp. WCC10]